jgi:hypothetical protein
LETRKPRNVGVIPEPDEDKSKIRENYSEIFVWEPWISESPLTRLSYIDMLSGKWLKFPSDRAIRQVFTENLAGVTWVIVPDLSLWICMEHTIRKHLKFRSIISWSSPFLSPLNPTQALSWLIT